MRKRKWVEDGKNYFLKVVLAKKRAILKAGWYKVRAEIIRGGIIRVLKAERKNIDI